ncbi:MAG: M20/M25/M40 family metallo-hydrolase, partial [Egibacteraceae bacterium]
MRSLSQVTSAVEAGRAVALLDGMLRIPSPSTAEAALAMFVARQASALGMRGRRDEVGNVIAETGTGTGDGPTILLLGHLDTAGDQIPVRREEGRLYGRGAVDAKGALAGMVCAAAARPDLPVRLIVAGAVEEETAGSRGANHLVRTLARPDAVIVGEPSGSAHVVLGYKGQVTLRYRVSRPATHPTNPRENAIEAAVRFWEDVRRELGERQSPSFSRPTAALLEIAGDMVEARASIDCRIPPHFDVAALLAT